MPRRSTFCLTLAALTLAVAGPAEADFLITIDDAVVTPGDPGPVAVNVFISSNQGSNISSFSVDLVIKTVVGADTLQFYSAGGSQLQQSTSFTGGANYVFKSTGSGGAASTVDNSSGTTPGGDAFNPYQRLTVGDFAASFDDVPVTSKFLLATIYITGLSVGATSPAPGDVFQIALSPSSSTTGGTTTTFFQDSFGSNANFTSSGGMVTVGAATVPEPGAWLLGLYGLTPLTAWNWWRGRRHRAA